MKNLLQKIKKNWLDYLIVFISVGAICFVYLFTAFYQPKESDKNINKENIVKVLRDKKNIRDMDIQTSGSVFPVGLVRAADGLDVEFFVNVESSLYTNNYATFKEIVLELTLNTYAIAYDVSFNKITSTINTLSYTYSVDIDLNEEIDRYIIGVEYFDAIFEDYAEDQGGSVDIDLYHTYDFFYILEDRNGNQVDGYSQTIEYNALTFITSNSNYWSIELYNNLDNGYNIRYNPNSILIPNNYQNGYNDGYNAGVSGNIGYENGYNAGYSDGYFDGTLDTEEYYENVVIPEQERIEYQNGYNAGYDVGYDYGEEIGYNNGYNDGVVSGSNNFNILDFIRSLFDLVWGVLNVEMLPNIKLMYVVAIPLVLSVIKFILGWFR